MLKKNSVRKLAHYKSYSDYSIIDIFIWYINFDFRFLNTVPIINSRDAPGSHVVKFIFYCPLIIPIIVQYIWVYDNI